MNVAYYFYCKIHVVFQNQKKIDFQIFVIYLNRQTLKTFFSQNSSNQNDFFNEVDLYTFLSSTCGQNMSLYEQILLPKQWL